MTSSRARERLALTVHEVRSPVAALAAVAEAAAGVRADAAAIRRLTDLAVGACRGLERLLAEVGLDVVLVDGVDIVEIAEDATAAAALAGAPVRLEVTSDIEAMPGDPLRLRQALDNLIRNALVHGPPGGEVVVRVRSAEGSVLVSVTNGGEGIPARDHARIFEPGVRLDQGAPGSGLGLTVVRAVAEGHGGSVTVASRSGEGATFTITLPASRS